MPGDVLMLTQRPLDKVTGKPFVWRWFGVVKTITHSKTMVLNLSNDKVMAAYRYQIEEMSTLLEEPDWPDGVRVLRLRAILEGRIDLEA